MRTGVFVTGTDTGCGKTHVAQTLVAQLRTRGVKVAGFKPVAAGAFWRDGRLQNADALALQAASGFSVAYETLNPYCFEQAVAPHLAAEAQGTAIRLERILAAYDALCTLSDFVVVEGAGGWRVPLGGSLDIQGLACALRLPVLLVVGLRLGCLNHALLSEQAIVASGADLIGWVGSQVEPEMDYLKENLVALDRRLMAPCRGVLPHPDGPEQVSLERPLELDDICGLDPDGRSNAGMS